MDFRLYDRPPRWTRAGIAGALAVGLPLSTGIGALYGRLLIPFLEAVRAGNDLLLVFVVVYVAIFLAGLLATIFGVVFWKQISNLWVAGAVGALLGTAAFYGLTAGWWAGHSVDRLVLNPWHLADLGWQFTGSNTWTWTFLQTSWRVPVWVNRCLWVLEFQATFFLGIFAGLAAGSGRPCEVCHTEVSRLASYRRELPKNLPEVARQINHGSLTLLRKHLSGAKSRLSKPGARSLVVRFHGCLECLRTLLISVAVAEGEDEPGDPVLVDASVSPAVFEVLLQALDPREAADFREGVNDFPDNHWLGVGAWQSDDLAIPANSPDFEALHQGNEGSCPACERAAERFG